MSTLINPENVDDSLKIAAGYSKSANILMKNIGQTRDSDVVHSMIVLRALALEIYLRCLYAVEHDKAYEGHHVKQIFDALGEETKQKVKEYYDRNLADSEFIKMTHEIHHEIKGGAPTLDIDHVLQEWAEAMGDYRYFFEPKHKVVFLTFGEIEKALLQTLRDVKESGTVGSTTELKAA